MFFKKIDERIKVLFLIILILFIFIIIRVFYIQVIDYKKLNSEAWFDYEVQKMCSVAASMATMAFNKIFDNNVRNLIWDYNHSLVPQCMNLQKEIAKYHNTLLDATGKGAMFDARCFNLPKEEVANYIYWRQLDATRNSIQMVGQANFSHKELHGKTCNMIQDMLHEQKGINWNDLDTHLKRGSCCIKTTRKETEEHIYEEQPFGKPREMVKKIIEHPKWIIDKDIPIFFSFLITQFKNILYMLTYISFTRLKQLNHLWL